ncbi:MAG TPA: glycosyltransferase family 2 protein [Candidatus Eisenbacteria bacterium]|nr:glycosyltransferase family 2 protein [Candidatus Eisenbacteria bacterium]
MIKVKKLKSILNFKNPLVYIVILNWNGYQDTVECMESLLRIKYRNFRVVLIDNASENNEYDKLIKKYKENSNIHIIRNKTNIGFAGGVNVGIKFSIENNADYTLLLNNDTIVDKYFLNNLIEVTQLDNKIAVLSPNIYFYNKPNSVWAGGSQVKYFFPPISNSYKNDYPGEVNEVTGCCMLIKNSVFKKIGLFREEYFAYQEEMDFNFRVIKNGYKIFVVPGSKIWHKVSSSTGGGFNKIIAYYKMRNKVLYAKFNYPKYYWLTYWFYIFIYFFYHQINSVKSSKFDTSKALMSGLIDGVTNKYFKNKSF